MSHRGFYSDGAVNFDRLHDLQEITEYYKKMQPDRTVRSPTGRAVPDRTSGP